MTKMQSDEAKMQSDDTNVAFANICSAMPQRAVEWIKVPVVTGMAQEAFVRKNCDRVRQVVDRPGNKIIE